MAFEPPGNVPWASLAAERRRDPELVVLDVATAKASAPSAFITLVRSPANLGFAGANNIGIVHALNDAACTHVWLLNNDTVTDPNAGRVLHAFSDAHPDVGIVAATLLYYHLPDKIQATGSHYSPLRVNGYPINQLVPRDTKLDVREVEARLTYLPGASMLVTRRFLETVGLMNEAYFLYFEELDWAVRSRGKFLQRWEPRAIVYHKEGRSIGTSSISRPSDRSLFFMTRSLLWFYRQHYPVLFPIALVRTLVRVTKYALKGDRNAARSLLAAVREGVFSRGAG